MNRSIINPRMFGVLRQADEALMLDICVRLAPTVTRNADNQETGEDWLPADPPDVFPCSFQPGGTTESGTNIVITTPILRLPLAAANAFTSRDRVRITHRGGVLLATPLEYGIDGDPILNLSSGSLSLKGSHT